MDTYGTTSQGKFVIQQVDTLPMFTEYDVGRMILVKDNGNYYIGGLTSWLGIAGKNFVKAHQIDFGTSIHQVNADNIPIRNIKNYFDNDDSIEDVLEGLAEGRYIQDEAILSKHIKHKSVDIDKLKTGPINSTDVGAHTLPYYHVISNTSVMISEVLDDVLLHFPRIINHNIDLSDWDFDTVTGLFATRYYYTNDRDLYPIIELYDQYGSMFIPSKLVFDKTSNKITIYVAYKMCATLIIVG